MAAPSARELSLRALQDRQGLPSRHLDRLLEEQAPSPAEAHLAMELTHGVVRHQRTLDAIIRAYSRRPGTEMPSVLRVVLRLGVYQLAMLERIPPFAAVDESVKLCRRRQPHATGFVNALLRALVGGLGPPTSSTEPGANGTTAGGGERQVPLAPDVLPLSPVRWRQFDRPVLPAPQDAPATYLAEACSLPDALARRWTERFHSLREAFDLAMQCNVRPPVIARVNLWRTTVQAMLEELQAADVAATAHGNGLSVVLPPHTTVGGLDLVRRGLLTPQDPTATQVPVALAPMPGMRVLDFCAAPGTKTTHLGELLTGEGRIVALDVNPAKLQTIEAAVQRCGLTNVQTLLSEQVAQLEGGSFDRVLVDAPCSNTGVLARRVEARWHFDEDALRKLAADQRRILTLAATYVSPGGRLVYSTCSIEPQENELLVRGFLKANRRWRLLDQKLTLPRGQAPPQSYHDGGYWALLAPS